MREAEFKWRKLSKRQAMLLTWWREESCFSEYDGIIADGAIRSGKTVAMGFSFVVWAMSTFNREQLALCGKTVSSLQRNVVSVLTRQLRSRGYYVKVRRVDNIIIVSDGEIANTFYMFGGKDESSQDLIQGVTLAGVFFDEVALMPESFVNQATARCSVTGSKFWFNCNPAGPFHWFRKNWILKCRTKKLVYLHFTMDDNLTLSPRIKERYKNQYSGVFYSRYILGLWVAAEGLIYDMFNMERHVIKDVPYTLGDFYVSSDFGTQNPTTFLLWRKESGSDRWICLREYYYSGRESMQQRTVSEHVAGLRKMLNGVVPKEVVVDPSATPLMAELRKNGFRVRAANNDVTSGIADVSSMLENDRIAFCSCCTNTISEFGEYFWDEKAANRGEDKPIKEHDHAMDAVRYFVRTIVTKKTTIKTYK